MAETLLNYKSPPVIAEESRPTQPSRTRLHYAALLETTYALNRIVDYYELLQFILEKMIEVSGADSAKVYLVEDGNFQFIAGRDPRRAEFEDDGSELSQGVIDRLYQQMDVVFVREIARDPQLQNDMTLAAYYISGVIVLPMFRGEVMTGIVYLDSHAALMWLDDLDISILKGMTSQIALATENAINLSQIAHLSETHESDIQERTQQLSTANEFLAIAVEKAEKRAATSEENEQKRGRFFSAMAHELRSPMQLLLGHATMILADGEDKLTEAQRKSLKVIMKTSEHVRDLVTKVMDARRLEESEMTISPVPFDLRSLIDELVGMGSGLLNNKDVKIISYYDAENLPLVVADPMRIRQVMLNLVANACRFTDKGKITISATEHDSYVVVSIVDTGTGIDPDKLKTIFEPYKQADSVRAHQGAGLGLSISKQLIDLHGGRMLVKSTPGTGSIFAFNLPIAM